MSGMMEPDSPASSWHDVGDMDEDLIRDGQSRIAEVDEEEHAVGDGVGRRGAWKVGEQRNLAEEVALLERLQHLRRRRRAENPLGALGARQ